MTWEKTIFRNRVIVCEAGINRWELKIRRWYDLNYAYVVGVYSTKEKADKEMQEIKSVNGYGNYLIKFRELKNMTKRKGRWLFVIPFVIFVAAIYCLTISNFWLAVLLFASASAVLYLVSRKRPL